MHHTISDSSIQPTQITSKSAPKFLPESQDENVGQPLCIDSLGHGTRKLIIKHTSSGSREYPIVTTDKHGKTYIKCSKILKDSIRQDNFKGKTQFITRE